MFSPCVFVCLCLYHDVCPDDLTMKDWCHTNNILQVHCWGCLVVQVMFHTRMTSSMTSPGHKVGQILKLIYLRQYLSYSVDQKLKISEMLMAIFLAYSTSGVTSAEKVCRELKMAAILKILKYQTQLQFDLRYEKIVPNYAIKSIIHEDDVTGWPKIGPIYSFINEITFSMITKKRANISSLNFLCIGIRRLWLYLYKRVFMTSLMTSPDHKVDRILKLIYVRQYLS